MPKRDVMDNSNTSPKYDCLDEEYISEDED